MLHWSLETLEMDLKFTWKISRGSTSRKINYIVHVEENGIKAMGEVAGITQAEASAGLIPKQYSQVSLDGVTDPTDINKLDICAPLAFGLESALIHLRAKQKGQSVPHYLGLEEIHKVPTSISLPILPLDEIAEFMKFQRVEHFPCCKIKVGQEKPIESCLEVAKHFAGPLRIDANEALQNCEDVLHFIDGIKHLNIEFLEQPMASHLVEEYKKLKPLSPIPIIADESLQQQKVDAELARQFHGINVKLMKTGGYLKAREQIQAAKHMGLNVMLGCMVETSLAIRSAIYIGQDVDWFDLDGFLFFKEEPFGLVQEKNGYLTIE
ncbi:MAG: hypothetical protein KDD33_09125 [Bdellovibrionales bacterium]|nr:hypothetical protein [Bdellovibrionales bacterium]